MAGNMKFARDISFQSSNAPVQRGQNQMIEGIGMSQ